MDFLKIIFVPVMHLGMDKWIGSILGFSMFSCMKNTLKGSLISGFDKNIFSKRVIGSISVSHFLQMHHGFFV